MSLDEIKRLQKERLTFLKRLWEITGSDKFKWVNAFEIGKEFGFDREHTKIICDYLVDEYLAEWRGMGGSIGITHDGIKEMESAITKPDEETSHFLPFNVIMVGSMNNSSITQGNVQSTVTTIITQNEIEKIKEIMDRIESIINKVSLDANQKADIYANLDTVKAQCKASTPKKEIILSALRTIIDILKITPMFITTELELMKSIEEMARSIGLN